MKITAEHIGKLVRNPSSMHNQKIYRVLGVYKNDLWLVDFPDEITFISDPNDWDIVEEPKPVQKPSERIQDIQSARLISHSCYGFCQDCANEIGISIGKYLDEVLPPLLEKK